MAPSNLSNDEVAELEVANGYVQFDLVADMVRYFLEPERPFALRSNHIKQLQAVAVKGLVSSPGDYRSGDAEITGSPHHPPPASSVGFLVEEMCEYVNDHLHEETPFFIAAYIMWRLNWIHPFPDGNGRTSRATSYLVLCCALKNLLPGAPTIPDQIQRDRTPYIRALEAADASVEGPQDDPDLSEMEEMLKGMLATQLLSVINAADGDSVGAQ